MREVYLYQIEEQWAVAVDGSEQRFGSRAAAFARAGEQARAVTPSRVIRSAPPTSDDRSPPLPPRARVTPRVLTGEPRPWPELAQRPALGRSILVGPGDPAPEPWATSPRVTVTPAALADPDFLSRVRAAYLARTPVVYEVDPALGEGPRSPAAFDVGEIEVFGVAPDFEFVAEAAWRLLSANGVDARQPDRPFWPPTALALRAGATAPPPGTHADVVLPDGRLALADGGPFRVWPADPTNDSTTVIIPLLSIERGHLVPVTAEVPTADLAPDQLAAVSEPGARARIIAPAGSGKTRVLTERVRHLRHVGVPIDAMCLVAFNKRAQEEMVDRTPDLAGLQVQTLNALALAIINGRNGFHPRAERVTTINEIEVRREIGELVAMPRRANTDPTAAWIDALSTVRLGLQHPAEVEADFGGDVDGFAEFFPRYRRALQQRDLVDFDEQIYRAIEVLLTEPDTRRHAQQVTRLLLVDEFQDLTPAHLLLIRLLAGPHLDVFGVGDDDQTIYGYSGASPDWLIDFGAYFPGAALHALEVNYRCPTRVVTAAGNLLSRNQRRVPKRILPGPGNVTAPTALVAIEVDDPLTGTIERIQALLAGGAPASDVLVLARVNTLLAPVQVALHTEGIAVTNRDGVRFLERTGVRAALSWLRIAAHPVQLSPADVQQAARRPSRSLSPRVIEWMGEQDDLAAIRRLAGRLKGKDADKVEAFVADAERLTRRAAHAPTADLLEFIRSEMGLDQTMKTLDSTHRGRNSAAHTDDLRALVSLGRLHPEAATFGGWLHGALSRPDDPHGVVLSTVHKVKGLEWPHVVVHDASQGLFPHRLSTDVEEERRVFHVAITRGQVSVSIAAEAGAPSLFIAELDHLAPPRPVSVTPNARGLTRAPASRSPRKGPAVVAASIGLELEWGGYQGVVAELSPDGVSLKVGRASFVIAFGSAVKVAGQRRTLGAPGPASSSSKAPKIGSKDAPSVNPALFDALKQWRGGRAKADAVPAYVVAKDTTLEAIAQLTPSTLRELSTVDGIGPAKLERYGDEILAIVDGLTP
jgi:DNA helicase-2/ATP-dependent DNA helicase PcrA